MVESYWIYFFGMIIGAFLAGMFYTAPLNQEWYDEGFSDGENYQINEAENNCMRYYCEQFVGLDYDCDLILNSEESSLSESDLAKHIALFNSCKKILTNDPTYDLLERLED